MVEFCGQECIFFQFWNMKIEDGDEDRFLSRFVDTRFKRLGNFQGRGMMSSLVLLAAFILNILIAKKQIAVLPIVTSLLYSGPKQYGRQQRRQVSTKQRLPRVALARILPYQ